MGREDFLEDVKHRLQLGDRDEAAEIARVVLMGLHLQLPEPAAREVEREMPAGIRALWPHGGEDLKQERGAHTQFARHQFITWVAEHSEAGDAAESERAIRMVCAALRAAVPISDAVVRRELSEGILELWAPHAEVRP